MKRFLQGRKVPKKFLQPRPMSGAPRPGNRLWGYLLVEVASVAAAALVVVLEPLGPLDNVWSERILASRAVHSPPRNVVVLSISANLAKQASCGQTLTRLLTEGGARAGLLLEPLSQLCTGALDAGEHQSELTPPVSTLDEEVFRRGRRGQLVGLTHTVEDFELLGALGFKPRQWVAGRWEDAIPVLGPTDGEGADASALEDKIAVVSLHRSSTPEGLSPRGVAAILGAALEDPVRRSCPLWLLLAVVGLINLGVALVQRRAAPRGRTRMSLAIGGGSLVAVGLVDWLGLGWMMPIPSMLMGWAVAFIGLSLPRRIAEARTERDAKRVLRGADEMITDRSATGDHAEFWQRLARTAAQAHPNDDAVVAELPAFSWRLKFWSNGETGDDLIRERRRDIRRSPYCNAQGAPVASVVHDYLVLKNTPALLVPILASGEVEGFLMLVGQSATDEFRDNPGRSENLAKELGQLIRSRRMARMEEQASLSPVGLLNVPASGGRVVLDQARAAMAELRLLSSLVQEAPVGLFYVDSFGDVRILGRAVARWLPDYGIELPALGPNGALDAGVLTLKRLLFGFARKTGVVPPLFTEIGDTGYCLEVPAPVKSGRRSKTIEVRVLPLRATSSQQGGFVGSLAESAVRTESMAPRPSIMAQTVASLQVFSLSQMMTNVVGDAAHRTEGRVRLQTPRDEANVVAHRSELQGALLNFLVEAARLSGKGKGPVVAVTVEALRVELRILDLRLNAPSPALERTLMAPSSPPPGLESLAELVRAVENSHGEVTLRTEEVWGTVLVANLVRAKPRVNSVVADLSQLRLHNKPVQIL